MIGYAIITAPRPRSTLTESYSSFRRAGFLGDVTVFAEPGADVVISDGAFVIQNEAKLGNLRNWVRALSTLLTVSRHEFLMISEDDISWASGACELLHAELPRLDLLTIGGMSLYLPRRHAKHMKALPVAKGWIPGNLGPGTWGFQCMVFRRDQAERLLNSVHLKSCLANLRWDKNVDRIVGESIMRAGEDILYRVPCLVDHDLGDANSSLGYRPDRPDLRTDHFAGPRA